MRNTDIVLSRALLPPGSRVLVAVSGGADSVCLLHLVRALGDVECLAAHFDHRLRASSQRDAAFVRKLCRDWGVELIEGSGDVAAYARRKGLSVETAGREMRYDFLCRAAEQTGAGLIATAHNRNDNAETVLFRMARGTGLRGLTGIPERRGMLVRPLLNVSRERIEAYLSERAIPHVEDETNAEDEYARNRIRHHVLPELEKVHGGAGENIARMTRSLAEDEAYLTSLAADWLSAQPSDELSAAALAALPRPIAVRALRRWLGEDVSAEHLEAALSLCQAGPSAVLDLPGRRLCRRNDALTLTETEATPLPERMLVPGGTLLLPEAGLVCECRECAPGEEIQISFNTFSFSCANICGTLSITRRFAGDKLSLWGGRGTHSVKKWMIEAKIPRAERESVPVVRDEQGILAVYGMGQGQRAAARPGEAFLQILFNKISEDI